MVYLYGLADEVRGQHQRMDSAIEDLKSRLNVPPILAGVMATDVLTEMEMVDQQLDHSGTGNIMDPQTHLTQSVGDSAITSEQSSERSEDSEQRPITTNDGRTTTI